MSRGRLLDALPGIYRQDPFLGEFLGPFEELLEGYEALLSEIDRYFDPWRTDAEFLPWLATWVALALDPSWSEERRRELIAKAPELYRRRGTLRGLREYLEIYTGVEPEIREWRWPGGMQIGVASRLGGMERGGPVPRRILAYQRRPPALERDYHDYYVVDSYHVPGAVVPPGYPAGLRPNQSVQIYYLASEVQQVSIDPVDGSVSILHEVGPTSYRHPRPRNRPSGRPAIHRREDLIDDLYWMWTPETVATNQPPREYRGDTLLVDEEERPYRFIVDVRIAAEEIENLDAAELSGVIDKVRAIVDAEKPAHTLYYLKLTPVQGGLEPMRIEIRSTVGQDTVIGSDPQRG